jgi:hypothetical protein
MPLSRALANVLLTHPCPSCCHKLKKNGSWFMGIRNYRCEACQEDIHMEYEAKIKLFDAHAHLAVQIRAGNRSRDPLTNTPPAQAPPREGPANRPVSVTSSASQIRRLPVQFP